MPNDVDGDVVQWLTDPDEALLPASFQGLWKTPATAPLSAGGHEDSASILQVLSIKFSPAPGHWRCDIYSTTMSGSFESMNTLDTIDSLTLSPRYRSEGLVGLAGVGGCSFLLPLASDCVVSLGRVPGLEVLLVEISFTMQGVARRSVRIADRLTAV